MNHALHMVAVTQIRFARSEGRAYYNRKITEGKTPREARRALKRQISDRVYRQLRSDVGSKLAREDHQGTTLTSSAAGKTLAPGTSEEVTPGPMQTLSPPTRRCHGLHLTRPRHRERSHLTQRGVDWRCLAHMG